MNREARKAGAMSWVEYGERTHAEAAELHAKCYGNSFGGVDEIETRDEGSEVVFTHRVTRRVVYDVCTLRGDER